ncbi:aspartate/tyrosine/aromatic aminotransferase [Saccharophagus degradans]|uniref:Amino acid aminotransferase n=1 Tax=Saccharophagus degradans TaxID=86304 RepID=A0AAW7X5T1_9GAMM|nr:amino acid aminotransferase [Saccharophagus degradans]MBU2984296.1 aspartate/tyrosine/aromatic aminotransferase [Saccharophagus degradans]MDO6422942.1 amino acid aminotransferase [Saccharophagus degradans]MDO6607087.1 amino acid aminotransferase [Saccharophagus degradans]
MFDRLSLLSADPILGLIGQYTADSNPNKIDLGVGVYRDAQGHTPILATVKKAESILWEAEQTKSYIGPAGNQQFNRLALELILGDAHTALADNRAIAMQTPGGCGALRVAAELIVAANPKAKIWVSDPTWGNHVPLLGDSGMEIATYPYYDYESHGIRFADMLTTLRESAVAGDLVLVHACCHNPSGADLSLAQWLQLTNLCAEKGLIPFVDMAYQGFGDGLDQDAAGLRMMADQLPEVIFAYSCSKNFGLYRERIGAVGVVVANSERATAVVSQIMRIVRGIYSMPPSHGAAIVETILADPVLCQAWVDELALMRNRIQTMRHALLDAMTAQGYGDRFHFITGEKGMFSFLGLTPEQVRRLIKEHSVYMVDSSRINVAGLTPTNIDPLVKALTAVL